jgi:prolyl oligopeptidase
MVSNRMRSSLRHVLVAVVVAAGCTPTSPAALPARPRDVGTLPPSPETGARVSHSSFSSAYPPSRIADSKDVLFGTVVEDPYRWLEDASSPQVATWLKAQDDLARAKLKALPNRASLVSRLKELFYVERIGDPKKRGNRYFTWKRAASQEKYVLYWKDGRDGAERVLLDPNGWTQDGSVSIVDAFPSPDGKRVAFRVAKNNADENTTRVIEVASGKELSIDVIDGTQYGRISWTPNGDGFYYRFTPPDSKLAAGDRFGLAELRLHKLGEDPNKDRRVHDATGDAKAFLTGYTSRDGHWLVAEIGHGWTANDVAFQDLRKRPGSWVPLTTGKDAQYFALPYRDRFYVMTNEGAPRARLFVVDPAHPARDGWREIVAERTDAKLEGIDIFGGKLVLTYLKDAATRLEVRELDGKFVREIALPAIGSASASGNQDDDVVYVSFTSFTHPAEILETSIATGASRTWNRAKVPIEAGRFVVEQVSYTSRDGTRVPMFIVHAKDLKKDGSAPLYLTGYGGFQISITPDFDASLFPWLERGGVFAVPNLRGGGEFGEEWHRAGMLHKKQNVFDDFFAAAEYLIHEGYTTPEKMMAYGASNGGLLMGAAITQRPDLFRVVVCEVPLLDMLRFDKSALGKPSVDEYGSPEKESDFRTLLSYSPYHHVEMNRKYPSVLMMSADSDDRVDPMHARKFTAALQARSSGGPVLLRVERNSGHGGTDMTSAWIERVADMYGFALAEIDKVGSSMR